jgi:hypothetical protein
MFFKLGHNYQKFLNILQNEAMTSMTLESLRESTVLS